MMSAAAAPQLSDVTVDAHPLLDPVVLVARGGGLEDRGLQYWLDAGGGALAPLDSKGAVRDLLRHGGFKPSGRNKPASEYVAAAVPAGRLGSINPIVDVCNAASFHSGLPLSVVDLACTQPPLRIGVAPPGTRYVFNASGQELDLSGLLALWDADGPIANAVKDSQRTKTGPTTRDTVWVIWGAQALPGRADATARWVEQALASMGAVTARLVG